MEDGNGKVQPEVGQGAINTANKIMVLTIYIDKVTQRVEVEGLLTNKVLVLNAVAEAIKAVINFNPSPIIQPGFKGRMAAFGRKIMGR